MKKLFTFLVIALLSFGLATQSYAADAQSANLERIGNNGGPKGLTPVSVIVPVRYAYQGAHVSNIQPGLSSGDVVIWDTVSADGYTISACVVDDADAYAGVLVTAILTPDTDYTIDRRGTRNWGYMCVKGYCLAKIDTSLAGTGEELVVSGGTVIGSLGTFTSGGITAGRAISKDIGVLLIDNAADGLMPVWLR